MHDRTNGADNDRFEQKQKTKATRNNSENIDKDEMLNSQKRENEEGVKATYGSQQWRSPTTAAAIAKMVMVVLYNGFAMMQ